MENPIAPGEHWFQGKLEFMLSQRGKPLLVHDGHTFGIQYVRKDKKYWQCNLSRKFNCKARVTTTDTGEIIVTNNEHCHTEIRQHLRKDYQRNKVMMNALINLSTNRLAVENLKRHNVNNIANNLSNLQTMVAASQAAAAAVANNPLPLQVTHQEINKENSNNGCLLDLGKHSHSSLVTTADHNPTLLSFNVNNYNYNNNNDDSSVNCQYNRDNHDPDMPLDCGIHSIQPNREETTTNHMMEKNITNFNSWEYKNETIP